MKKKLVFIIVAAVISFAGMLGLLFLWNIEPNPPYPPQASPPPGTRVAPNPPAAGQWPPAQGSGSLKDKFATMGFSLEDQLVKELQKYYGATISEKSTQASIYEIYKSFAGSRPDGREFFYKILKRAFPDYADAIMDTLDKLDLYHQWLLENDAVLAQMNEEEKMAALWKKRIELFGDDAQDIWVDEVMATDARKAKMLDTLEFINGASDMSIDDKLQLYQDSLQETYHGTPEAYFLDQKPILAKIFFSIDSVQDELKQMSPEQRQATINHIRRQMGFSEEQVAAMEQVDADNNRRWEVGLKYMEERKRVVEQLEGEEEKAQLQALREKYFGDEAQTIQLEEEKDGFFRFERPRYYGRN